MNKVASGSGPGWRQSAVRPAWLIVGSAAAIAALSIRLYLATTAPASDHLADLQVYVGSVRSMVNGHSLYAYHAANGDPFTYPPAAGLLLLPIAWLPAHGLHFLWNAASVAAVVGVALMAAKGLQKQFPSRRPLERFVCALLVLALSAPIASNIRFGQISLFVIAITLAGMFSDDDRVTAALLSLAICVKLTPIVFVPYLWLRGRRRAALLACACSGGIAVASAVILPSDSRQYWLHYVFGTSRYGNTALGGNQSIHAMLQRAQVAAMPAEIIWTLVAITVVFVGYPRALRYSRAGSELVAISIIGCISLVLSPVSWTHHQTWVLGAIALPAAVGSRFRIVFIAWILMVMSINAPHWYSSSVILRVLSGLLGDLRGLTCLFIALGLPLLWPGRVDSHEGAGASARGPRVVGSLADPRLLGWQRRRSQSRAAAAPMGG